MLGSITHVFILDIHFNFLTSAHRRLFLLAQSLQTQHQAWWYTVHQKLPQLAWKVFSLPDVPFFFTLSSLHLQHEWAIFECLTSDEYLRKKQQQIKEDTLLCWEPFAFLPWAEGELADSAPGLITSECVFSFNSFSFMLSHIVFPTVVTVFIQKQSKRYDIPLQTHCDQ